MPLHTRDDGLSEVVGFVLILGLIVVALSLYQVYGVPAAGRENEIAQMNQVKDRFVDYKIALDSLWINNRTGVLVSTAFDLGTGSAATGGEAFTLPIFSPAPAGGTISVREGGTNLKIEVANLTSGGVDSETIPLGSISYRSLNRYWIDQTWTYQMGAIFLRQNEGETVRVGPSLSIYNTSGEASVVIAPVRINGTADLTGSGSVRIETRLRDMPPYEGLTGEYPWVNISIEADDKVHARAWERAFEEAARREGVSGWCEVGRASTTAYILIVGPEEADDDMRDVKLKTVRADYLVSVSAAASLIE